MGYSLPFLLDGAPETLADRMGFRPGDCQEEWFYSHPAAVCQTIKEYLEAGAQAVCAPTFGANRAALAPWGLQDKVGKINRGILQSAKRAAEPYGVPVGASLSPTGLFVPPHGEADFDDLYSIYREQIRAVEEAGADFAAVGMQSSLADMRAAVLAARTTDLPIFVTLNVDGGGKTLTGGSLLPIAITLQAMNADAVGLDGFAFSGETTDILADALPHLYIPLIAKIPAQIHGASLSPTDFSRLVPELFYAGAGILGGSLGSTPEHIRTLRRTMDEFSFQPIRPSRQNADCYAAATESEAFFLGDNIILSEPIECSIRLEDDLIDLDDEQVNAALVELETLDDVEILTRSALTTRLPIAVHTSQKMILDAALRYFQGRLIVDSNCDIDYPLIERAAAKYGAIIY